MRYSLILGLLLFTGSLFGQNYTDLNCDQQIDYLIARVESLDSATFIRNGISYTAKQAADHLAMKRNKAGRTVKTVNDFIEKIASESSMTGQAYLIRYSNGNQITAKSFYHKCLKELKTEE